MTAALPGRTIRTIAAAACLALLLPAAARAGFGDRPLERGMRGHDVRVLQSWLTRLGFATPVDGSFGNATERNVKGYERKNGLPADGKVSTAQARRMRRQIEDGGRRRTQRASGYRFGERVLARGARGHDVRVLQSWLTRLGISTGVDGVFGAGTERSLLRWEERGDPPRDGELSRAEARRMRAEVESGQAAPAPETRLRGGHVFPVSGAHRYGDGFGADRGGRSHRGQDLFAACGTPLVAAQGGRVEYSGFHSAAGNYVVITGAESREDYVYMHLRRASSLRTGDGVATGAQIGEVGESGNASGCHLHFELWSAPGWYKGGQAYDPLPALRSWDG